MRPLRTTNEQTRCRAAYRRHVGDHPMRASRLGNPNLSKPVIPPAQTCFTPPKPISCRPNLFPPAQTCANRNVRGPPVPPLLSPPDANAFVHQFVMGFSCVALTEECVIQQGWAIGPHELAVDMRIGELPLLVLPSHRETSPGYSTAS